MLSSLIAVAVIVIVPLAMFIVFGVVDNPRSFGRAWRMSVSKLPKAGDFCSGCKDFWEAQKLPAKHLVHVFDEDGNPLKTDSGIEIIVCPHCDGDVILRLDKHSNAS